MLAIGSLLSGCSLQPDYREATQGGYGYSSFKMSETQYQVSFKSKNTDKQEANNFALLRAAELTLSNGFDWFVVEGSELSTNTKIVDKGSRIKESGYQRITDCNLIGCRISYNPSNQYKTGNAINDKEIRETQSILIIEMGRGPLPSSKKSYDAKNIQETFQSHDV